MQYKQNKIGIMERIELDSEKRRVTSVKRTSDIAFVMMCEQGVVDSVTAVEHLELFSEWKPKVKYAVGNLRQYGGKLYKCKKKNMANTKKPPNTATDLWELIGNPNDEYPAWSAPICAEDEYMRGDRVTDNGVRYINTLDHNATQPSDGDGWTKV